MNEVDLEHRLTEVENRAKSNTHRIDELKPIVEEIHTMSKTMVQLVQEVKQTNNTVTNLDEKVERMDKRVDEMEVAPAKKWTRIWDKIIDSSIGVFVAFVMAGLIWAAVQAYLGG